MKNKVLFFFSNGNTAVFHSQDQVPDLQKSWLRMFADFLVDHGEDPTQYEINLPHGLKAEFIKTPDGYNWSIL